MFSFFKKKKPADAPAAAPAAPLPSPAPAPATAAAAAAPLPGGSLIGSALVTPIEIPLPGAAPAVREHWVSKLRSG
ncbi:MAG: signal recognition particle-docking protein FtsY, partial [Polaromonas sp.]